jgi:hypothetical protein
VTSLEPGLLHSPDLPALPAGGYYRILTLVDTESSTELTVTATNTTGYGLFAASSPKLVEDANGREHLDPATTLNPVFLDGSKTAGAYNGSNKHLVLRPNTGGMPVFLQGYSRSAVPAALRTISDGQTVKLPVADLPEGDGDGVAWLSYNVGRRESVWFVIVAVPAPGPQLAVSDATILEGNGGAANATFTVTLSAAAAVNVAVNYATVSGTATVGSDFTAKSGTLTFLPGQTSKTASVPAAMGTTTGRDKDFFLALATATNAVIADGVGLGTVRK